jgi:glutamyl-Q tRNA(Asp) synthetase
LSSHLPGVESIPHSVPGEPYVGRFAPSPTGALHFGSLLAAVASYLQARVAHGQWLVRIEDLDSPRVVPGAADDILRTLSAFGFEWDGAIIYQSQRLEYYAAALANLSQQERTYSCSCSRTEIAARHAVSTTLDAEEQRYPGTCRHRDHAPATQNAIRFVVPEGEAGFVDRIQGPQAQDVAATVGDFVVRRRDGIYAYHLAVVVDDAAQGITEVVRGADLLSSTARQIRLQQALAYPTPAYAHIPVAVDNLGHKLSKAAQSLAIQTEAASSLLWLALQSLRQTPPPALQIATVNAVWSWAIDHWSPGALAGHTLCPAPAAD